MFNKASHVNSLFILFLSLVLVACGSSSGSDPVPPQQYHAFVTSETGTADLSTWTDAGGQTGLAAADAICQANASGHGHDGNYRAWLSDSNNDAYCRMHDLTGKKAANCGQATLPTGAGPWTRHTGVPFAAIITEMLAPNGIIINPVSLDEMSNPVVVNYYTNTTMTGEAAETVMANTCDDFTNEANANGTSGGRSNSTGHGMTQDGNADCNDASWALLCMRVGTGAAALPTVNDTGNTIFVTAAVGTGDLSSWPGAGVATGVAAGDAICNDAATTAGIAGTFKAWLSDNVTNAVDHITSDGPWVRVDGVTVATNKADLIDGNLLTPINVTENGDYIFDNMLSRSAWTGTDETGTRVGTAAANRCADWTDGTAGSSGDIGGADRNGNIWSNWNIVSCDGMNRLYCLED